MVFGSLQCVARGDVDYVVEEQKPVCDFCAMGKKLEKGCYTSIVSTSAHSWASSTFPMTQYSRGFILCSARSGGD